MSCCYDHASTSRNKEEHRLTIKYVLCFILVSISQIKVHWIWWKYYINQSKKSQTNAYSLWLKKIHTVKILNQIPTWFAYRWAVRFFPDSEVNSVPSWIMGEIMIPLVTWNLRVSARACGSVLSWSRTLCGSLAKAASVGAKIVKGVAWRQKNGLISI